MQEPLNWQLSVSLQHGTYTQIATMDFVRRETIELQLVQFLFKQRGGNSRTLYEFTNELGELFAFRASAYVSHSVTPISGHGAVRAA
jgi:hypothetical protein